MLLLNEDNCLVKGMQEDYYVQFDSNDGKCEALVDLWSRC